MKFKDSPVENHSPKAFSVLVGLLGRENEQEEDNKWIADKKCSRR